MSRRQKQKPRRPRRRTANDVVRTHLAIITSPSSNLAGVSLHRDVELTKAALLYADTVEILSLGQQMVQNLQDFLKGTDEGLWTLLNSLDDKTLRQISGGTDPARIRQAVELIKHLDPAAPRSAEATSPDLEGLAGFANVLQQTQAQATESMTEMRSVAERLSRESGADELDLAFRNGHVRYNSRVPLGDDTDVAIAAFMGEVKRYLEDPLKLVLLDHQTASLVRSMIKEEVVRLPARSVANAEEALLGTGFLAKLPTFSAASMEQVLGVRAELEEPLGRYRRKVTGLRSHLLEGPFDEHADAEVHGIWRTEIDPAVREIRTAMTDNSLAKELLREGGLNLAEFAKGAITGGGLSVLTASITDVSTVVATGVTIGAGALPIATKALINQRKARSTARANDLYYLHAVDQELAP